MDRKVADFQEPRFAAFGAGGKIESFRRFAREAPALLLGDALQVGRRAADELAPMMADDLIGAIAQNAFNRRADIDDLAVRAAGEEDVILAQPFDQRLDTLLRVEQDKGEVLEARGVTVRSIYGRGDSISPRL